MSLRHTGTSHGEHSSASRPARGRHSSNSDIFRHKAQAADSHLPLEGRAGGRQRCDRRDCGGRSWTRKHDTWPSSLRALPALGTCVMESLPVFLRSGCLELEGFLPQNHVRCLRRSGRGRSVEVYQGAGLCFRPNTSLSGLCRSRWAMHALPWPEVTWCLLPGPPASRKTG